MSLTRGRITGRGEPSFPGRDRTQVSGIGNRGTVTVVAALAPRYALVAAFCACLVALAVTGRADGAGQSWVGYLAPASVCPGSDDPAATPRIQERAVRCLVNWARSRSNRARLARRSSLGRAATLKGREVASCHDFSHSPCGVDPTAAVRSSGYRYATFGENLFLGTWGRVSARDAVAAWLESPGHRANILGGFRDLGAALVRAPGMRREGDGALWITAFATPR